MLGRCPHPESGRITDKVKLVEPLASGGMSWVWLARHRDLDAEVVVKLIDPEGQRGDRERFAQEARIASRLSSPHVVRVYDAGTTEDGFPFIVMERLRGETLAARLERGSLEVDRAVRIVAQIAEALAEAHEHGIVHRDVKPANVFLVDSALGPHAKVLDFGVAKLLEGEGSSLVTQTGAVMGTPAYMSPEQLLDASDVDHRSDLWSLAVVAYEMVCGRRPFSGSGVGALSLSICEGCFEPPSAHRPALPPAVDAWFARALSASIDARFEDARTLAASFAKAARTDEASASADEGNKSATTTAAISDEEAGPSSSALATTLDASTGERLRRSRGLPLAAAALPLAAAAVAFALAGPEPAHLESAIPSGGLAPLLPPGATEPERPPASGSSGHQRSASRTDPERPPAATPDERPPSRSEAPMDGGASKAIAAAPSVEGTHPGRASESKTRKPASTEAAAPPDRSAATPRTPAAQSGPGANAGASDKPAHCATDDAFVVDERGVLQPRPECL